MNAGTDANILILGAGVMGSAIAVPAADNGHRVRLATTPAEPDTLAALHGDRGAHPKLGVPLPESVEIIEAADLAPADAAVADLVVVGVSSPGIDWAVETLVRLNVTGPVALVTKGLVRRQTNKPETYADWVPRMVRERGAHIGPLVGIGGPCIAAELAERLPTSVIFASLDTGAVRIARALFETSYYRIALSTDVVGVEACAALKNFFAIGVSAMMGRYRRGNEPAKNPVATVFQQAVNEIAILSEWLGGETGTAHGLAGLGDLHVTVGGGRNSRLGREIGTGQTIPQAMAGALSGETVEGVDTARAIGPALLAACDGGDLDAGSLPLALAIIGAVSDGSRFDYTP